MFFCGAVVHVQGEEQRGEQSSLGAPVPVLGVNCLPVCQDVGDPLTDGDRNRELGSFG